MGWGGRDKEGRFLPFLFTRFTTQTFSQSPRRGVSAQGHSLPLPCTPEGGAGATQGPASLCTVKEPQPRACGYKTATEKQAAAARRRRCVFLFCSPSESPKARTRVCGERLRLPEAQLAVYQTHQAWETAALRLQLLCKHLLPEPGLSGGPRGLEGPREPQALGGGPQGLGRPLERACPRDRGWGHRDSHTRPVPVHSPPGLTRPPAAVLSLQQAGSPRGAGEADCWPLPRAGGRVSPGDAVTAGQGG